MHKLKKYINNKDKYFCIDVDDVLINTTSYWMRLINEDEDFKNELIKQNKYPMEIEDIVTWNHMQTILGDTVYKYHINGDIYNEYEVIEGSKELIELLYNKIGKERILFVTASEGKNEEIKDKILNKEFGITKDMIVHTSNKHKYYNNNICLDDGYHNLENFIECEQTLSFILNTPWNKSCKTGELKRINNLNELIILLKNV